MKKVLSFTALTLSIVSCKSPVATESVTLTASASQTINKIWNAQQILAQNPNIQLDCQPKVFESQGPQKGVVMLFHGFSACPQQFYGTAEDLSKFGYKVYVPLLPGHGYVKSNKPEHRDLPNLKDGHKKLENFVTLMNEIVRNLFSFHFPSLTKEIFGIFPEKRKKS